MSKLQDYIGLNEEEIQVLTEYADLIAPLHRPTYRQDPDGFIRFHAIHNCRVWKQGVGTVVGETGWSPAQILTARRETYLPCGCIQDAGVTISPCAEHRDIRLRRAMRRAAEIAVDCA